MPELPIDVAARCASVAGRIASGHDKNGPFYATHKDVGRNVGKSNEISLDDIGDIIDPNAPPPPPPVQSPIGFNGANAWVFCGSTSLTGHKPYGMVMPGERNRFHEALITFRGSTHLSDYVLTDMAMAPSVSSGGFSVHGGFNAVFKTCAHDIDLALEQIKRTRRIHTVHIAGHSMGGALATLCAEYLIDKGYTIYLYTFGAPRVGLRDHCLHLVENLQNNIFRFYFPNDWITWLPILPYWHLPGTKLQPPYGGGFVPRGVHGEYFKDRGQNIIRPAGAPVMVSRDWREEWNALIASNPPRYRCMTALRIAMKLIGCIIRVVGGIVLFAASTIVDQLVHLFMTFGMTDSYAKTKLGSLAQYMLTILGKPFSGMGKNIKSFFSWLLELFLDMVRQNARETVTEYRSGQVVLHWD